MPGGGSRHPASHETIDQRLHYVKQDGQTVFRFAVRNTEEACRRLLDRNKVSPDDIDLFVSHQANRRIIFAAAEKLGVPEKKVVINIEQYGNTTAATIPLGAEHRRRGQASQEGRPGADGVGGRRLHGGRDAAALGPERVEKPRRSAARIATSRPSALASSVLTAELAAGRSSGRLPRTRFPHARDRSSLRRVHRSGSAGRGLAVRTGRPRRPRWPRSVGHVRWDDGAT